LSCSSPSDASSDCRRSLSPDKLRVWTLREIGDDSTVCRIGRNEMLTSG
jgi:hypothetical protein